MRLASCGSVAFACAFSAGAHRHRLIPGFGFLRGMHALGGPRYKIDYYETIFVSKQPYDRLIAKLDRVLVPRGWHKSHGRPSLPWGECTCYERGRGPEWQIRIQKDRSLPDTVYGDGVLKGEVARGWVGITVDERTGPSALADQKQLIHLSGSVVQDGKARKRQRR